MLLLDVLLVAWLVRVLVILKVLVKEFVEGEFLYLFVSATLEFEPVCWCLLYERNLDVVVNWQTTKH